MDRFEVPVQGFAEWGDGETGKGAWGRGVHEESIVDVNGVKSWFCPFHRSEVVHENDRKFGKIST